MYTVCKLWFGLVICLVVRSTQARASPLFPQRDDYTFQENSEEEEEQEENHENIDDVYDEEKKSISEEEKEFDKDDKKKAAERTKVASALGLRNYSSHAIEELIMTYLTGRAPERPTTPKPKPIRRKRTTTAVPISTSSSSTKKYKVKTMKPSSNGNIMPVVIKVPDGNNGSIAINIPMDMVMSMKAHNHSIAVSNSSLDEQQVKNIQTSIMKALLITERIKSMFMSTTNSPPGINSESLVPANEQAQRQQQNAGRTTEANISPNVNRVSNGSPDSEEVDEPSLDIQSPLLASANIPAKGAVTEDPLKGFDEFMTQFRNRLPEYVWQGIVNLSKTNYGEMAVDAVECMVFRHCPDHTSLGANIKYLI